jgi:hypothetical protein
VKTIPACLVTLIELTIEENRRDFWSNAAFHAPQSPVTGIVCVFFSVFSVRFIIPPTSLLPPILLRLTGFSVSYWGCRDDKSRDSPLINKEHDDQFMVLPFLKYSNPFRK